MMFKLLNKDEYLKNSLYHKINEKDDNVEFLIDSIKNYFLIILNCITEKENVNDSVNFFFIKPN